jgi:hypothetical protein
MKTSGILQGKIERERRDSAPMLNLKSHKLTNTVPILHLVLLVSITNTCPKNQEIARLCSEWAFEGTSQLSLEILLE